MTDVLARRRPVCGSELEHGPHEYTVDLRHDGTEIGPRDRPGFCAGWTATEAGLCVMLREVQRVMLEKAPPDGSVRFRLECSPLVAHGLQGLFLPADGGRVGEVSGAVLVVTSGLGLGGWQLTETRPPVAAGTISP